MNVFVIVIVNILRVLLLLLYLLLMIIDYCLDEFQGKKGPRGLRNNGVGLIMHEIHRPKYTSSTTKCQNCAAPSYELVQTPSFHVSNQSLLYIPYLGAIMIALHI